jgi:uncharacterized delta-60 repeat protein
MYINTRKVITMLITTFMATSTVLGQLAGTLDLDFGNDGTVLSAPGSPREGADVLYFPDNTILTISSVNITGFTEAIEFAKYDIDGNLDLSWGTNGLYQPDIPNGGVLWAEQAEFALAENGFYVSGGIWVNSMNYFIAKFKTDGTLDETFGGGDGYTIPTFDGLGDYGYGMTVQPDGKILITGQTYTPLEGFNFGFARFNNDGSLDNSFGTNGVVSLDYNNEGNHAYRVKVNATNGKIYTAGWTGLDYAMVVAMNSDGTLDNTFGVGGFAVFSDIEINSFALEIQSDGKLVVVGGEDATVFRLDENGVLDVSFGTNGIAYLPVPPGKDFSAVRKVILQPDGKILAGGYTGVTSGWVDVSYLARLNIDGSLDNTFGENGVGYASVDLGSEKILINNIRIQPDGKILTMGVNVNITSNNAILNRFLPDNNGVSIAEIDNKKMNIFPNPVIDILSISAESDIRKVKIYSLSGKLVQTELTNYFSVEKLSSGVYLIEVHIAGDIVSTKFTKE